MSELVVGQLIHGMPYQEYHDLGIKHNCLRASMLKTLRQSPAHMKASLLDNKETEALRFGKLFHAALENQERFREIIVVEPEFWGPTQDGRPSQQSKAAKEKRAAWRHALPKGAVVATADDIGQLASMLNVINQHSRAKNIIKDGVRETSGWVKDPETGVILQFRPDLITTHGFMVDYKTTRNAHEDFFYWEIFGESVTKPFYILAAAHYVHCAKLMGLKRSDNFVLFAIEKEAPYGLKIFPLDQGCLDVGERWRRKLTKLYAKCLETNVWPSYDEKTVAVVPPQHATVVEDDEEEVA